MVKTIYEQTGWRGPLPVSICQDMDILLQINEYDYDLTNKDFEEYCHCRGRSIHAVDPRWFHQLCDLAITKDDFFNSWRVQSNFAGINVRGTTRTTAELEGVWQAFRLTKGQLQDCWEIFMERRYPLKVVLPRKWFQ
ncbi:MAG: hypothetical protein PF442_02825 [Desulfobulbaceae bacterium]|nr:hypothetical protein [Desulfobulbaceae bacterium]